MEISYRFSRFGRYSYDIVDVLETTGFTYNDCDKTAVLEMAKKVREMILLSVAALQSRDKDAVSKLYEMDDTVDTIYRNYLLNVVTSNSSEDMSLRCYASALLILKYFERISDHACYVGDYVNYIVTGASRPRR
jgi:phosphate transport system protein